MSRLLLGTSGSVIIAVVAYGFTPDFEWANLLSYLPPLVPTIVAVTSVVVILACVWIVHRWWRRRSLGDVFTVNSGSCCRCGDYYEKVNSAWDARDSADISDEAFEAELKKYGVPVSGSIPVYRNIKCCQSVYKCPCRLRNIRCNKNCTPSAEDNDLVGEPTSGCLNQAPTRFWSEEKKQFVWYDEVFQHYLDQAPIIRS
jgi:hypothetical protein